MAASSKQIVRIAVIVVVTLVILYLALGVICVVRSCIRDRGIDERRYSEWLDENRDLAEAFDELSAREGWKLIVASQDGNIARLDFGQKAHETLFECDQRVVYADQLSNGLYALGICSPSSGKPSDCSRVVFVEDGREVGQVDFYESYYRIIRGRRLILSLGDRVIYLLEDKVVSHDLQTGESEVVLQENSLVLKSACESDDLLYVIMGDTSGGKTKLIILKNRSPYERIGVLEGVGNVTTVGCNTVLQKGDEICSYDPTRNTTKNLVSGDLVMGCGEKAFIYHVYSKADLMTSLWLYDMSEHTARQLLPSYDFSSRSNRDTLPFLSPDNKYLFVAESPKKFGKPPCDDYWWCLYELETGKEMGRFYAPYKNECHVDFVLGWEE